MALEPSPTNGVPTVVDVSQLIDLLEGFVGEKLSRMTITNWIAAGYFPNKRKRSPQPNSKLWIPLTDVSAYVLEAYPTGPITTTVDPGVQKIFDYIVTTCYPVPA